MRAKASFAALAWASPGERQVQAAACMSAPMPRPRWPGRAGRMRDGPGARWTERRWGRASRRAAVS